MILSLTLLVQGQDDLQKRIQDIDVILDDTLSSWKINEKDVPGGEKVSRDDSEWPVVRTGTTIRDKIFWLRQQFQAPENFAGVRTQGSEITLSCIFRGLGVMEGHFFQDGELKDSFILEFGNQSNQIKKEFVITTDADPEEESLLAFRFKNLGRLPLINKKVTEPGTYFQLQEARFRIQKSQDAHEMLSLFLLDLKIVAMLLDILPVSIDRRKGERPISALYTKFSTSKEIKNLKKKFEKALMHFDLEALRRGDSAKIKTSLLKFYKETKPITRFLKSYTIHVAGNSHIDLAWLWRWRESVEVAKETFSTIMDNIEEYPGIVYVQSQAQAYQWMEDYYPDVFERIKKKVKEGRWEIMEEGPTVRCWTGSKATKTRTSFPKSNTRQQPDSWNRLKRGSQIFLSGRMSFTWNTIEAPTQPRLKRKSSTGSPRCFWQTQRKSLLSLSSSGKPIRPIPSKAPGKGCC